MKQRHISILIVLGIPLVFLISYRVSSGIFQLTFNRLNASEPNWPPAIVSSVPEGANDIPAISYVLLHQPSPYVLTDNGEVYQLEEDGWVESGVDDDAYCEPCNEQTLNWISAEAGSLLACCERYVPSKTSPFYQSYAISDQGDLWQLKYVTGFSRVAAIFTAVLIGMIVFIIGSVVVILVDDAVSIGWQHG